MPLISFGCMVANIFAAYVCQNRGICALNAFAAGWNAVLVFEAIRSYLHG